MKCRIHILMLFGIILLLLPNTALSERWLSYSVENGRTDNIITAVFEDSSDNMWFGTVKGDISRYDGSWVTYDSSDGLSGERISDIKEDDNGTVWVATSKGIYTFDGTSWSSIIHYAESSGVFLTTQIYKDQLGVMWFGINEGIGAYDGSVLKVYNTDSGLLSLGVKAVGQDSQGNMIFGTDDGAFFYDGEDFVKLSQMNDYDVHSIYNDSKGNLWFCTGKGIVRYDGFVWTTFTIADWLENYTTADESANITTSVEEDGDGVLWFGTIGGVVAYDDASWKSYVNEDGLTIIGILDITVDKSGNIWCSKSGEVFTFDRTWLTLKKEDGLLSDSVSKIIEDSGGAFWIGTTEGLSKLDGEDWTHFSTSDGLADNDIKAIYEDVNEKIWVGTTQGVSCYDGDTWTTYTEKDGLANNLVSSISGSENGLIWFAGGAGLSSFDGTAWKQYTTDDNLPDNAVYSVFVDSKGIVWAGTAKGAGRFSGETWTTFTDIPALSNYAIFSITEDPSGNIWFAMFNGFVVRHDGDETEVIIPPKPVPTYFVLDIAADSRGDIWIGTNAGFQSYDGEKWKTASFDEGLSELLIFSIIEDVKGDIWFGTLEGVYSYHVDRIPPETYITSEPENIIGEALAFFQFDGGDRYSPDSQILFSYAFMDGTAQPSDSDWSDFSLENSAKSKSYPNGVYTFYVRSSDQAGNIDRSPASKTFTVDLTPPTVIITSPTNNGIIYGTVPIEGSAFDNSELPDIDYYLLEYGRGEDEDSVTEWHKIVEAENTTVVNGTLADWDTQDIYGQFVLRLKAVDKKNHISKYTISVSVVAASKTLEANRGGHIGQLPDNVDLYVPPNAITTSANITITPVPESDLTLPDDSSLRLYGKSYDIEPSDMRLSKPATFVVAFDESDNSETFQLGKLGVFQWAATSKSWEKIGGTVDLKNNTVTTVIEKFGRLAVFEDLSGGSQKKAISSIACQPRVFSPKGKNLEPYTTLSFDLKKSSNVTVKVYNTAGRLVKIVEDNLSMNDGTNAVRWDGVDRDGDSVVSGLYIFTIEADGAVETQTVGIVNK